MASRNPSQNTEKELPNFIERKIFEWSAPPDRRQECVGDLIENYRQKVASEGKIAARRWLHEQTIDALQYGPLRYWFWILRIILWIVAIGVALPRFFG
jgi:hypothetical protein